MMNSQLSEKIRRVTPYVPGEQPREKVIKLNTNENPYPPSPAVREVLEGTDSADFRLYPDPEASGLVEAIADFYGLDREMVFPGVGSDDVLAMCFLTFFSSGERILFPDVTYSFYRVWGDLYRIPYECPALDDEFHIKKEDYYEENGGIIFPNPNAPTSLCEEMSVIEDIVSRNQNSVVIVDEAYIDFGGTSAVCLLERYENLLVVQTFSKSRAMAGMRIGYALGNKALIRSLNDVKYSFNSYTMSSLAIACGIAAVRDREYFEKTIRDIRETRTWFAGALRDLGFDFPEPGANFVFCSHPKRKAGEICDELKGRGIYVRHFPGGRTENYLRITIGTREDMGTLLKVLRECV